jgi:hypothetical protein
MSSTYKELLNKPSIEDKILEGNKTTEDFGFQWHLTAGTQMELNPLRPDFKQEINAINVENPVSLEEEERELSPKTTDLVLSYEDVEDPNIAKTKLHLKNTFAICGEEWTDDEITVELKTDYDSDGKCKIEIEEIEYEPPEGLKEKTNIDYIEYISGVGSSENPLKFDIEKFAKDFLKEAANESM